MHHLIAEEFKRKTHSVIRVEEKVSEEIDTNRKRRRRAATIFEPRPAPKLDPDFLRELGRIGNNVNQIAKAINSDIAGTGTFDKVKLLHLLISIDQQLREIRPNDR